MVKLYEKAVRPIVLVFKQRERERISSKRQRKQIRSLITKNNRLTRVHQTTNVGLGREKREWEACWVTAHTHIHIHCLSSTGSATLLAKSQLNICPAFRLQIELPVQRKQQELQLQVQLYKLAKFNHVQVCHFIRLLSSPLVSHSACFSFNSILTLRSFVFFRLEFGWLLVLLFCNPSNLSFVHHLSFRFTHKSSQDKEKIWRGHQLVSLSLFFTLACLHRKPSRVRISR